MVQFIQCKNKQKKAAAYLADITYGTNNEFGFDYLRDNMVFSLAERNNVVLHYAIIDEVDSILIDEARTPLIISGQSEDSSHLYTAINTIPPKLRPQKKKKLPMADISGLMKSSVQLK